ncbi:MAG: YecA family protein, partial [bacterium]
MNNKPGRNEPCPCGSGKKYKKCCMEIDNKMYSFEELGYYKTGNNTYDSFLNVLNAMSSMRDDLAECTRDGLELQGQMKEFVHMFRPGDIYPLSYFTAWSVIDCCFGKSYSSVLEKSAGIQRKKEDKGIELLFEGLLFSYPGFFLVEKSEGKTYFKALYNDERFKIDYVPEKWQVDFREDTLLFTRIFGFANIAFPGIEPLVFTDKAQIKKLIAMDKEDYREFIKHNKLEDEAMSYIDMNREMFIVRLSMFKETVMAKQGVLQEEKKPVITNTDGQLMYFITIYMNVIDEETLVKKLDNMKRIEKGEKNEWVWTVDREIMPGGGNTIRGLIRKKRDELIVEVNSFQRAVKILSKIDKELSREAVYTRHEVKEVD